MHNPKPSRQPVHSLIARMGPEERIEGYYRFQRLTRKRAADGMEVWHVRLADRSGVLDTYVPCEDAMDVVYPLPEHLLVHTAFRTRQFKDRLVADLLSLDPLVDIHEPGLALDRLPRPAASSGNTLDELAALVTGMHLPVLRHAVDLLLNNEPLAASWITATNQLFERSVAAATTALELPLGRDERDLLMVACLFREVGELPIFENWSHDYGMPPPIPTRCLTLERCAPALQWLDDAQPAAARCLRQLWTLGLAPVTYQTPLALAHGLELATELARKRYPVMGDTRPLRVDSWD